MMRIADHHLSLPHHTISFSIIQHHSAVMMSQALSPLFTFHHGYHEYQGHGRAQRTTEQSNTIQLLLLIEYTIQLLLLSASHPYKSNACHRPKAILNNSTTQTIDSKSVRQHPKLLLGTESSVILQNNFPSKRQLKVQYTSTGLYFSPLQSFGLLL